jgi:hypothetical protein
VEVDMDKYNFKELSRKAKNKAIKDYCNGWLETHEDDPLDEYEVEQILLIDLADELYDITGNLLEEV